MKLAATLALLVACTPTPPPGAGLEAGAGAGAGAAAGSGSGSDAGSGSDSGPPPTTLTGTGYGTPHEYPGAICSYLLTGSFRVAEKDLRTSFVDGNDLLALVNRSPTGSLAPDFAPDDLLSFSPRKPRTAKECESLQCLRKDAMEGYDALVAAMKAEGFLPSLQSAYRSYKSQCGVFAHWAGASNACKASQQSALPGHSQHQLGTVVDLFTEKWRMSGPSVFRHGFGCNPAGAFLREEAWKYGWVVSYPIHPDDRLPQQPCEARFDLPVSIDPATGYAHEAWHIRFVGPEHARDFHEAAARDETLTLEQWLRQARGLPAEIATELPVCDGCNCGACGSLDPTASACHDALPLPPSPAAAPTLTAATWKREADHVLLTVTLHAGAGVTTQPPLFRAQKAGYERGEDFAHVVTVQGGKPRAFPDIAGTFRLATGPGLAWRIALPAAANATVYDRANVILPVPEGDATLTVRLPEPVAEVALLQGGVAVAHLNVAASP